MSDDTVHVWAVDGAPVRFSWQDRLYTVRSSTKTTAGHWRVNATPGTKYGVYELRHDPATGTWLLSVIEREAE